VPESFDPYFEWLGIESGGRPPQHYCLLGLECREPNPEVIARAADAAMARLRRVRPGTRLAEWGRLLDQLRAVKVCLLNPASKAAYDASLADPPSATTCPSAWAASSGPHEPVLATPPTIQPMPQPESLLAEIVPTARPAASAASTDALAASWRGPLIAGLLVLMVGLGGALGYVLYQQGMLPGAGSTTEVAQHTAAAGQSPAAPTASHSDNPKQTPQHPPDQHPISPKPATPPPTPPAEVAQNPAPQPEPPKSEPAEPKPEPEKPDPTVDEKKAAAFAHAVTDARTAMSERDLASARKHIKTASANAQNPEDGSQIDRLETMVENLTQFWNGIRASVAKLQPAEEIVVKDDRIVVVESGRDYLTVRAAGRVRRYQIEAMPTPLVRVIVDLSFGKDAGSKAIIGTFLAVDPDGDRALAKKYWQQAAKAGIDSEKLLRELDGAASAGPAAGPKLDPPTDKARLDAAGQAVRDRFKMQYDAATSLVKKVELVRELLARAPGTKNGDARFVMFREAKDLAVAAGQATLACEVVDQLARHYTVDPLGLKAAVLEEVGKKARGLSSQRDITQGALTLVDEAINQQRLVEAGRLAVVALEAARKCNSATLMRQATAADQQVQTMQKEGGKKKKE